jgi:hypothetical protein
MKEGRALSETSVTHGNRPEGRKYRYCRGDGIQSRHPRTLYRIERFKSGTSEFVKGFHERY